MYKIMIVDDDPSINELLQIYFDSDGFECFPYENGEDMLADFQQVKPDAIILDLMLPGLGGFDVLRRVRQSSDVAVLMLTARGDTLDKVVGLELGADDYVEKPFEPKELVARVKAVLRRSKGTLQGVDNGQQSGADEERAEFGNLVVDKKKFTVTISGQQVEMPPKELELLFFLVSNPDRVFTREQLLENIWGFNFYGESRTVDVHIKRIREKLDRYPHVNWLIKTVWGVGYKFETRPDKA